MASILDFDSRYLRSMRGTLAILGIRTTVNMTGSEPVDRSPTLLSPAMYMIGNHIQNVCLEGCLDRECVHASKVVNLGSLGIYPHKAGCKR